MVARIARDRERVWRARTDPAELVRWRPGLVEPLGTITSYPEPGQSVRWRCRLRDVPVQLRDKPVEVAPGRRLRSELVLGLFAFEETFTLDTWGGRDATRVTLKIATRSEMPVVGGALDRFAVRRFATDLVAISLDALRDWCEGTKQVESTSLPRLGAAAF